MNRINNFIKKFVEINKNYYKSINLNINYRFGTWFLKEVGLLLFEYEAEYSDISESDKLSDVLFLISVPGFS